MYFTDEKDYIMRMIKEMVRVLFSLMFGKKYVSVELEKENKYEVSGKNLKNFLDMIDSGEINEAENILLDSIDYNLIAKHLPDLIRWKCIQGYCDTQIVPYLSI